MKLFSKTYYHATKADFDKFDFAFMSTGEGAQAHGWGIYLAEEYNTAYGYSLDLDTFNDESFTFGVSIDGEEFVDTVSYNKDNIKDFFFSKGYPRTTLADVILGVDLIRKERKNIKSFLEELLENINREKENAVWYKEQGKPLSDHSKEFLKRAKDYQKIYDWFIKHDVQITKNSSTHNILRVRVDDDSVLAREDLPIYKQNDVIRQICNDIIRTYKVDESDDENNWDDFGQFYNYYANSPSFKGPEQLSKELMALGLDGISYNGSNDGECVVMINLDKVTIIEKE